MMKQFLAGAAPASGSPGVPGAMLPVTLTYRRRVVCLCWVCVIKTVEPPTLAEHSLHASGLLMALCPGDCYGSLSPKGEGESDRLG